MKLYDSQGNQIGRVSRKNLALLRENKGGIMPVNIRLDTGKDIVFPCALKIIAFGSILAAFSAFLYFILNLVSGSQFAVSWELRNVFSKIGVYRCFSLKNMELYAHFPLVIFPLVYIVQFFGMILWAVKDRRFLIPSLLFAADMVLVNVFAPPVSFYMFLFAGIIFCFFLDRYYKVPWFFAIFVLRVLTFFATDNYAGVLFCTLYYVFECVSFLYLIRKISQTEKREKTDNDTL